MVREMSPVDEKTYVRFWSKVNLTANPDKCWNWMATAPRGYGSFHITTKLKKSCHTFRANRIAYFVSKNIDPKEFVVAHTCDNKLCCNPNHLFLATQLENIEDRQKKGRQAANKGEKNGQSKLKPNQVIKIRKLYATGKYSYPEIAKIYSVDTTLIGLIVRKQAWNHI